MKWRPKCARGVAVHVLHRVEVDGAWATPTLDATLGRTSLERRDAALATAIVYGALRVLPALDEAIDRHCKRAPDPWIRALLRVTVFQLRHLEKLPPRAIVHEAVELARQGRGAKVGGFVNAVARKLSREIPEERCPPTTVVVPKWVAEALEGSLGAEGAGAFLEARRLPPPVDLRVRGDRQAFAGEIAAARPEAEITVPESASDVLRLRRAGDPRILPGWNEGRFSVQEMGSRGIAAAVGVTAGQCVADVCAGRGGKTTALAEVLGADGEICAVELHERRLEQIPDAFARLGLETELELEAVDLRVGTGGLGDRFEKVLVDAPCSGLGTLHRRPEMLLRLKPKDIEALAKTQAEILKNAATMVAPGGELIFVVCSPLSAEGLEHSETELLDAAGVPMQPQAAPDGQKVQRWGQGAVSDAERTDAYQLLRWKRQEFLDASNNGG